VKVENIKTFFDWLEKAYYDKIKAVSALNNYWRVLKRLYRREAGLSFAENIK
jgi:hypothetical protein